MIWRLRSDKISLAYLQHIFFFLTSSFSSRPDKAVCKLRRIRSYFTYFTSFWKRNGVWKIHPQTDYKLVVISIFSPSIPYGLFPQPIVDRDVSLQCKSPNPPSPHKNPPPQHSTNSLNTPILRKWQCPYDMYPWPCKFMYMWYVSYKTYGFIFRSKWDYPMRGA